MKAMVYERYGPPEVLHLKEVEKPRPGDREILIQVHATTVTAGDWRMRKADPFFVRLYNGLFRPKRVNILGFDVAGVVDDTGAGVTEFKTGDPVFAWCGFGFGGYAEYVRVALEGKIAKGGIVAPMPAGLPYGDAAAVPTGGLTALSFLRKGGIRKGQKVLIYGASGSVGTFAVQIAKAWGTEVTGVCSEANRDLVSSLGADRVLDYRNLPERLDSYDILFDAVGKISTPLFKQSLKKGGSFLSVQSSAKLEREDLLTLKQMIEQGGVRPVIDRSYPLEQAAEAHSYVEQEHKKGNVILTLEPGKINAGVAPDGPPAGSPG